MNKIELSGPNAFYKDPNYKAKTLEELSSPTALPQCHYRYETESKIWRVVKIIFAILIPLIGLYWGLHALAGKAILPVAFDPDTNSCCDKVKQAIYDSSRSRAIAQNIRPVIARNVAMKVKRLTIEVNGTKIDAMIVGSRNSLSNGRWVLHSIGNADLYEPHLFPGSNFFGMLRELQGNALIFNYPGKGASEGFRERSTVLNTYRAMLQFLEDKEKGIGSKEIVLYGHSIGSVVQGEVLATHELKKDIRYVAVKDRGPADLSSGATSMMGGCAGLAVKALGWNMSSVESSRKLKCPEVILQTMPMPAKEITNLKTQYDKEWVDHRYEIPGNYKLLTKPEEAADDGIISAEASLGRRLLADALPNKSIIGMYEWHNDDIYNWHPICNIINSKFK